MLKGTGTPSRHCSKDNIATLNVSRLFADEPVRILIQEFHPYNEIERIKFSQIFLSIEDAKKLRDMIDELITSK